MRIWHEKLVPLLCQKHLCAMWREGLGAYKIIVERKTELTYYKHPATQEFTEALYYLWQRLYLVRGEMLARGYHPKELPNFDGPTDTTRPKEWQTLDEQITILKAKQCKCKI